MSLLKNTEFVADPLAFMRKYSVKPGNDILGRLGDKAVDMVNARGTTDYVYSTMRPYDYVSGRADEQVAYLNFTKRQKKDGSSISFAPDSEGSVSVEGDFTPGNGKVKAYFLPWTSNGGIIRMQIPTQLGNTDLVKYFFTATISGCSFFIKGGTAAPEVFHAGGNTGQTDPMRAAQFWRDLMTKYASSIVTEAEVNKTEYVSDPLAKGKGIVPGTRNSDAYLAWLNKDQAANNLKITQIFPWGCIFGLLDNRNHWKFYLQENATIMFANIEKKGGLLRKQTLGQIRQASRPMVVREIFPTGTGHVAFQPDLQRPLLSKQDRGLA